VSQVIGVTGDDLILDELPFVSYERLDPNKSPGFSVNRLPYITFFDGRSLTSEERMKLGIFSNVYKTIRMMELDKETGKEAARIALKIYEQQGGIRTSEIIAATIAAAMEKGVAISRESVERAYEKLSLAVNKTTDEIHNKIKKKLMKIMMEFGIKSNWERLTVSYVNLLANAIGADNTSRVPMIVLARAINRSKPTHSAATSVEFFKDLMRIKANSESLWKMVWPPIDKKKFIVDSVSLSLGVGNKEAPDVESRTAMAVCAKCGTTLYSIKYKQPTPMNPNITHIPLHIPSVCPHCGAKIWDNNRLILRSVKVIFKYRHNNTKVDKIKASVMMPMESSIAIKK